MLKILGLIAAAALAAPASNAAASPPRAKASETAKATFLKKCIRDGTKRSCTAPPEARASK
jgi:hypothetical protein